MSHRHLPLAQYRTIDKYGGIDNYLLKHSDAALDSDVGSKLKRELEQALARGQQTLPAAAAVIAEAPAAV